MRVVPLLVAFVLLSGCVTSGGPGLSGPRDSAPAAPGTLVAPGTSFAYTSQAGSTQWDAVTSLVVAAPRDGARSPGTLLVPSTGGLQDGVAVGAGLQSLGPWRGSLERPDPICSGGPCDAALHAYMQATSGPPRTLHLAPASLTTGAKEHHLIDSQGVYVGLFLAGQSTSVRTYLVLEVTGREDGRDPAGREARLVRLVGHLETQSQSCSYVLILSDCDYGEPVTVNETVADPVRLRYDPGSGLFMDGHVPPWASAMPEWWFLPPGTLGAFSLEAVGEAPTMDVDEVAQALNERAMQDLLARHGPLAVDARDAVLGGGLDGEAAPVQANATYTHGPLPEGVAHRMAILAFDDGGLPLEVEPFPQGATARVATPTIVHWKLESRVFGRTAGSESLDVVVSYEGEARVDCTGVLGVPGTCPTLHFPVPRAGVVEASVDLSADVPLDTVRVRDADGTTVLEEEPGATWSGSLSVVADGGALWGLSWEPTLAVGEAHFAVRVGPVLGER